MHVQYAVKPRSAGYNGTFHFKKQHHHHHCFVIVTVIWQQIRQPTNLFLQQKSAGLPQFSQQESCLWSPWILVHWKSKAPLMRAYFSNQCPFDAVWQLICRKISTDISCLHDVAKFVLHLIAWVCISLYCMALYRGGGLKVWTMGPFPLAGGAQNVIDLFYA